MNAAQYKGFARTNGGRLVYDTGRIHIGLRAGLDSAAPRRLGAGSGRAIGRDAEVIQALLLQAKTGPKPAVIPTTPLGRLWAWVKALTGR